MADAQDHHSALATPWVTCYLSAGSHDFQDIFFGQPLTERGGADLKNSETSRSPDRARDWYQEAGVDVVKGDRLVDWLQSGDQGNQSTPFGSRVAGIGGFAALFRPNFAKLQDPLLISSTDGVGTKVLLGMETGLIAGLGQDLVAMCVNDLYTLGGRPLFFLDYYATGSLDEDQFKAVLSGIKAGCQQTGALLLGGETAEMPGLYQKGHFDLAGFVVGVVDGARMLGPTRVQVGDALYALVSSGFHSNGYSLLRKWVRDGDGPLSEELARQLMTPTRIYHEIPRLLDELGPEVFHAVANITGGGISGNLPRVMPPHVVCAIESSRLPTPPWMASWIQRQGTTPLAQEGVFNLGCGMIASIADDGQARFEEVARGLGLDVVRIGTVISGQGDPTVIFQ